MAISTEFGTSPSASLGQIGSISLAAAAGQGPYLVESNGTIVDGLAFDNTWWGLNGLASINFSETAHIEVAAGYKNRDGDQKQYKGYIVNSASYDVYAVMGGLYYTPVDQLTLGIEAEWSSESINVDAAAGNKRYIADDHTDTLTADVAANWAF